MEQSNILIQISPESLQNMIGKAVLEALEVVKPREKKYLTRKQVAEKFAVTLPTVHSWINSGRLKAHKMGGRTLFEAGQVEQAAVAKQVYRYKHGRA
jgi:excisionase family DNA binding protein